MAVQVVNLTVDQGIDFSISLNLRSNGAPINLTGYEFFSKIRKHYTAESYYPFNVLVISPAVSGNIIVGMSKTITSTIPIGRYVYDVVGINSGVGITTNIAKYFKGTVIVEGTSS